MITTIAKFCAERNVSRQFVYDYIKKGKFKLYETQTYAKIDDEFVALGTTKVLEVPIHYYFNNTEIDDSTKNYIVSLSLHPKIQEFTLALLQETDRVKRNEIRERHQKYVSLLSETEQDKLNTAMDSFNQKLLQKAKDNVLELETILSKV